MRGGEGVEGRGEGRRGKERGKGRGEGRRGRKAMQAQEEEAVRCRGGLSSLCFTST